MNIKKEMIKTFKNLLGVYFGKVYTSGELKISDKVVGGKVEMIQADGSLAPAEDGDYVMDNGFSFTVKDGMIESIVGEEAPAEVAPVEEAVADAPAVDAPVEETPAEENTEDTTVADLTARVDAMEKQVADLVAKIDGMNAQKLESDKTIEAFTAEVKSLNDNIQLLAKVPVQFSKTNKSNVVEETKEEQLFSIAKMIGSLK